MTPFNQGHAETLVVAIIAAEVQGDHTFGSAEGSTELVHHGLRHTHS